MKAKKYIYLAVFIVSFNLLTMTYKNYLELKAVNTYIQTLESYDNLLEMPDIFINSWAEILITCFINEDSTDLQNHSHYFTPETFEKIINSIENTTPIGIAPSDSITLNSRVRNLVVEKSYSLSTSYIICNFIIEHPQTNFSGVYLLQLLVNRDGLVYGFNIWQY